MIEYEKLSNKYKVRKLEHLDIPIIWPLLKSNPLYYKHCPPSPTEESIYEDLIALPANKTRKDKYYLGFFEEKELLAVMDMIDGYPTEKTVFWGLFMMDSKRSGKGFGSQIVGDCLKALKEQGFKRVRLAYMKTNPQSKAFWEKNGFIPTGVETHNGQGTVVVLEKVLNE